METKLHHIDQTAHHMPLMELEYSAGCNLLDEFICRAAGLEHRQPDACASRDEGDACEKDPLGTNLLNLMPCSWMILHISCSSVSMLNQMKRNRFLSTCVLS